ncbi:hypothetical protein EVAR_44137_1 [Eumeta japonica]|uniref:Uncharacterized protein n=1 Tax=Eumeta variegata TaxID=151549 RepID=A0A4C1XNB2_EUMVA|nr:hypothetical protein EVAR_44137_1 [Eumeta japonica]
MSLDFDQSPELRAFIESGLSIEFDRGRVSLLDEICEGRPSTAIAEENVATVRQLMKENRRITYGEM